MKQLLLLYNTDSKKENKITLNFIKKEKKLNEKFWNIKIKEQIKGKLLFKNFEVPTHNNKGNLGSSRINNIKQQVFNKLSERETTRDRSNERVNKNNNSYLNNSLDDYNAELLTKKFDFFDIGYLLIYAALGGMDIINFTEYTCIHENNEEKDQKEKNTLKYQAGCCCLFHCVEKYEKCLKTKLKITNYINNKRFTQEFIDFLCLTTSYDLLERNVDFSKLKNHSWLNMKHDKVDNIFSFTDLHKTYSNKKKNLYEKNVDNLIDVIARMFPNASSYYQDNNFKDSSAILNKENKDLVELAEDIGVEFDVLVRKLKPVFDINMQNND